MRRQVKRRQLLKLAGAAVATSLVGGFFPVSARAAIQPNLRFRAFHKGLPVGEHSVAFRYDGDRLTVTTHIDIAVKVLFFTAFRLKHDAEEVWRLDRLVSVRSTTDDGSLQMSLSGYAADDGFRILGTDGPFLAASDLLTSNTLWDRRIVRQTKLIDIQHGGEIGLVAKRLDDEAVGTPLGPVNASRYRIITPHYAGSLFYDADGRWVKGLIEQRGEILEYVLTN